MKFSFLLIVWIFLEKININSLLTNKKDHESVVYIMILIYTTRRGIFYIIFHFWIFRQLPNTSIHTPQISIRPPISLESSLEHTRPKPLCINGSHNSSKAAKLPKITPNPLQTLDTTGFLDHSTIFPCRVQFTIHLKLTSNPWYCWLLPHFSALSNRTLIQYQNTIDLPYFYMKFI